LSFLRLSKCKRIGIAEAARPNSTSGFRKFISLFYKVLYLKLKGF
jgi:hypothetical protein